MSESNGYLWLEVSNVRTWGAQKNAQVQIKGDRTMDKEAVWWDIATGAYETEPAATAKEIFRALDSKRTVLAGIGPEGTKLVVRSIRIQFSDSEPR